MPDRVEDAGVIAAHGASELPSVTVDGYNAELRDSDGFIGDRASNRAFRALLEDWRDSVRPFGDDPLGEQPSAEVSKKSLDKVLQSDDLEAIGVVQGAIEDFAKEFTTVTRRLLRLKGWKDTQRIVVGGGFREARIGELMIGRAGVLLKAAGHGIELKPIRHHPDEAGLIGGAHLAPSWIFSGHDSLLAVDIGGTNIRTGIVETHLKEASDLSKALVHKSTLWRHADDKPKRDEAVDRLVEMLQEHIARATKEKLRLAPFISIGCPGVIQPDGSIERGAQNLPGNWESARFNLPQRIREAIPEIDGHQTAVVMHNDAVVQGLSQVPFMQDVEHWGVLTIGTGLGNAHFTNKNKEKEKDRGKEKDKGNGKS